MSYRLISLLWLCVLSPFSFIIVGSENINALDSDYVFLDIRETTLPLPQSAGLRQGVFAKTDIPASEILCEYRGAVITASIEFKSDYSFTTADINGERITVIPHSNKAICSFINDGAHIIGANYKEADLAAIEAGTLKISTYPGAEYNTRALATKMGKIFIVSSKFIPAGAELFFSYGNEYWLERIRNPVKFGLPLN